MMSQCSKKHCTNEQTHHSATSVGFNDRELEYLGFCAKHAKIRWIDGFHMMKMSSK